MCVKLFEPLWFLIRNNVRSIDDASLAFAKPAMTSGFGPVLAKIDSSSNWKIFFSMFLYFCSGLLDIQWGMSWVWAFVHNVIWYNTYVSSFLLSSTTVFLAAWLNGSNIIDSDEKPTARTAVEGRARPMAVPGVSPVFNRSPIWKIFDFIVCSSTWRWIFPIDETFCGLKYFYFRNQKFPNY